MGDEPLVDARTGLVPLAPGHRPVHHDIAKQHGLEIDSPADEAGRFTSDAKDLAGLPILDSSNTIDGCADRGVREDECRIASDTTVDLWTRYSPRPGTSLSANVFNLFDRREPVQLRPGGPLPLRSRTLMLTVEHTF